MAETGIARRSAVATATLVAAIALSAAVIHFVPPLGERVLAGMPGVSAPTAETIFTAMIFGPFILIALAAGAIGGVNAVKPGRHPGVMALLGLLLGLAGVTVAIAYTSLAGTLGEAAEQRAPSILLLWGAGVVLLQAGAEEIFFRGWLQRVLQRSWGTIAAVVLASLAFAALHVLGGARSPVSLLNLFLGGVMFGTLAAYGRGIAAPVAAHFAWNAAEQLLVGLDPNPGVGGFGALIDLELSGAGSWGGSEEGLNASVAMTATLLVIVITLILFVRYRARAGSAARRNPMDD